jgi:multisubunit Na+/H+ antiporter MnhF subunit
VNGWLLGAAVLQALVVLVGLAAARGPLLDRLVCLQAAGALQTVALLLMCQGFGTTDYLDVAFVLAPLSLVGTLVFARYVERWP